eukprot:TRINITY_DN468_c0_g1_i2.p1 TRINITY_DN468_c0_g1~~TRINITY_DN468_c0_g1_i2.p1  ORF type:complete len:405 (+),score=88.66 TRINITY_DN468_c0_g1_i2:164-1378(+)
MCIRDRYQRRVRGTHNMSTLQPYQLPTEHAPHLLAPATLGDMELRNRIAMAPLTRGRANVDRTPNSRMASYYRHRAEYTGMVIAEATTVNSSSANGWVDSPGIYTEEHRDGWREVVQAVHQTGCHAFVLQLWHMGRAAHSSFLGGAAPKAASAVVIEGDDGVYNADGVKVPHEVPEALTAEEIHEIVEDYRRSAVLAKAAGFDGVEVHAANGYLINTFLDSTTNLRTDEYGGSAENRMRFLNQVLEAVVGVFGAGRVGVRLSPNGAYNGMGATDSVSSYSYFLSELGKTGLAYVHVMDGLGFGFHDKDREFTIAMARAAYGPGNILCNVGYDRDSGDAVIAAGHANAVAIGRPFMSNPDLPYLYAHDLPVAEADPSTWFTHGDEGYDDFPSHVVSGSEQSQTLG